MKTAQGEILALRPSGDSSQGEDMLPEPRRETLLREGGSLIAPQRQAGKAGVQGVGDMSQVFQGVAVGQVKIQRRPLPQQPPG